MAEPLANRMRPRTFDEVVGQRHLFGAGKPLTALVGAGTLPSHDPVGARRDREDHARLPAGAARWAARSQQLSAVASGVADARKVMERAQGEPDPGRAVRRRGPPVEQGAAGRPAARRSRTGRSRSSARRPRTRTSRWSRRCSRGACCCAWSRCRATDLRALMDRALADPDARPRRSRASRRPTRRSTTWSTSRGGDARVALTGLEAAVLAARSARRRAGGDADSSPDAVQKKAIVYDRQGDAHYDVISAFIKSIRGSRPRRDAVLAGADDRGGRGRRATSRGGWSCTRARTSAWPTRGRCWWRRPPRTRSSTWGCRRRG